MTDGALYGDGWVKWLKTYDQKGNPQRVSAERKHPLNLFIDPSETAFNDKPSQLFERSHISKLTLMERFPELATAIKGCGTAKDAMVGRIKP